MDFLLCCPRGPDHQGRHAVPEAESAADGPPWAAGAEKDRKRKKLFTRLHSQRGQTSVNWKCELMWKVQCGRSRADRPALGSRVCRCHQSAKQLKSPESGSVPCAAQDR